MKLIFKIFQIVLSCIMIDPLINNAYAISNAIGGPKINQLGFQEPVTSVGHDLWDLHNLMLIICILIFVGVFSTIFYSIIAHRKSKNPQPANFHESTIVEMIWTIVPFLIVITMAIPATKAVIKMKNTRNADLTIKITGYQWKWGYDYLKGQGEGIHFISTLSTPITQINGYQPKTNTYLQEVDYPLVVPVNRKIRILTTAADVIHSWYVPAFGVKQDAFPGLIRESWFKVEKIGIYRGFCTELCGKQHAFMPIVVNVISDRDYNMWVYMMLNKMHKDKYKNINQAVSNNLNISYLESYGKKIFVTNCIVCHQINGKGNNIYPPIKNSKIIYGPIVNHIKLILYGKRHMPAWQYILNDKDIAAVATYQRNALGNHTGEVIQPQDVSAVRSSS